MAKQLDPSRREHILTTALYLFADRGYYGVSVGEIAKSCQIAAGSLYTYFTSKQDLVNELYGQWKTTFAGYIQKGLDADLNLRARHKRLWNNLFEFAQDHPIALSFLESQHHSSYLTPESKGKEQQMHQFGLELYHELINARSPGQRHSRELTQIVLSISYGGFIQLAKMAREGRVKLDQKTLDSVEKILWGAMTNQVETASV